MLTPAQHRSAIFLLGLMLVGMVLEALGISLVVPILALMTNSNLVSDYPMLVPWLERLGNPSHEKLVAFSMFALVSTLG